MARRTANKEDDGFLELVLDASWEHPVAGFAGGGLLLVIALVLYLFPSPGGPIVPITLWLGSFLFCLLGSVGIFVSLLSLAQRRFSTAERPGPVDAASLRAMHWRAFERYVADTFRRLGYRVQEMGGRGDGGELAAEGFAENELSLVHGWLLLSAYRDAKGMRFYVITEADRSVTTVLLP